MPSRCSPTLALAVVALLGLVGPDSKAAVGASAAAAPAPRVGPRGTPLRANVRRGATPQRADNRAQLVEGNLRDLNRSLETARPGPVQLPRPNDCPGCAERADLGISQRSESELALRGNLHRLKRETRIQQQPERRRNQVEDALATPPAQ